MRCGALLLVLAVVACSPGPRAEVPPAATDQRTVEPASPTLAVPSPTQTTTGGAPSPTPVARTITGRATLRATGAAVARVEVRLMPMAINDGRPPGPDVTAVTDDRGAYSVVVQTWSVEALAASSSFQLMVQVTPPPGLLVLGVGGAAGGPPGMAGGNLTGALFVEDLARPIDISLGPGHIVEGTVVSGVSSAPLAGVHVSALGPNSMLIYGGAGDAFEIAATTSTDQAGRYRLTVPSGTFAIRATGTQDGQSRFWSDDPAVFQASLLRVERDVSGVDMAVVPVAPIAGYVRSGPSMGDGVEGTRVTAFIGGAVACCRRIGVAMSGGGGTFLLQLPRGTYRLLIEPPAGSPYAAQWWRAAAGFASATDVTVASDLIELEVQLAR